MNPITTALNSKIGMKLQGRSVVDNKNNPASAVSAMRRSVKRGNSQTEAMDRALAKASSKAK